VRLCGTQWTLGGAPAQVQSKSFIVTIQFSGSRNTRWDACRIPSVTGACESGPPAPDPRILFETLHIGDQRLQIIRRQIDGGHAAGVHLRGGMFEKFG